MLRGIGYKSRYGNYMTLNKEFNDEEHFSNWYQYMSGKGYKIISVIDITLRVWCRLRHENALYILLCVVRIINYKFNLKWDIEEN